MESNNQAVQVKELDQLKEVRAKNTSPFLYDVTKAAAEFRNTIEDGTAIMWSSGELLVHILSKHGLKIEREENDDPVI